MPERDDVHVRGFVHEVIIGCGNEVIARHKRSYASADMIFDPLHFLPLLEQKVGALDQAAPLQGWDLPPSHACKHALPGSGCLCDPTSAFRGSHGKAGQARICSGSTPFGNF
jgi:hypothetical protein